MCAPWMCHMGMHESRAFLEGLSALGGPGHLLFCPLCRPVQALPSPHSCPHTRPSPSPGDATYLSPTKHVCQSSPPLHTGNGAQLSTQTHSPFAGLRPQRVVSGPDLCSKGM